MHIYTRVFEYADKILDILVNNPHHRMMEENIYRHFEKEEHSGIRSSFQHLIERKLIKPDPHPYYTLLGDGSSLQANGGYKEEFKRLNKQEEEDSIKKWYDTENAKQIFDDYPIIKRNAKISIIIAAISAALALIAIMKK